MSGTRLFHSLPKFRKDLAWFDWFLPTTDGTFIINQDDSHPVQLYIDACMSCHRALMASRAYHATFPPRVLWDNPLICHPKALKVALAIKWWAPQFVHQLFHLVCDNHAAVFQADWGKDAFLQGCAARDIWQTCAQWDITFTVSHILGAHLQETADTLSQYHLGPAYRDRVASLISDKGVSLH